MSRFLEVAVRNAGRGFRVHPLRGKDAFVKGWPHLATTDEAQINAWAEKFPDYNVGVAAGDPNPSAPFVVAIVDSDRVSRLKELAGPDAAEWFNTYSVTSGRPDRAHFYYRMTPEVYQFGNKHWGEPGIPGNVFELKVLGGQVVAEGSTHPDTGQVYRIVQDLPLIEFPAGLMALMRECYANAEREGRNSEPIEGNRNNYLTRVGGKLRNAGLSREALELALLQHNADVCQPPLEDEEVKRIAASVARYDVPGPEPEVFISANAASSAPADKLARVRPVYPIEVWDGTAVGEFAKLCAHDNNIPRKLYAESFRTVLGAVVGNQLSCPTVEGAIPRCYTIIIAPFGKGKGSAIRRATRFFSQQWYGTRVTPGLTVQGSTPALLSGCREFIWKPQGIGAWNASASSVPGMAKLAKDLDETIEERPQLTWGTTLPRILSVHEEMKTFFSTIYIDGGVGVGMDGVICQLWDDVEFNGTATGGRDALYGQMMFSLLGGVTPDDWFDLISHGNAVGGGLMSRLNLIGTEGNYDNVPKMTPPNFTALQESFLPRIKLLADVPAQIASDEGAERVIAEWADTLPEGSERLNVQVWRAVLLLAWLHHEEKITARIASDAVRLGQYQAASQAFYRVCAADNPLAKAQGKIERVLEMKGGMSRRDLRRFTNAGRIGTTLWNAALDGLIKERRVYQKEGRYFVAD